MKIDGKYKVGNNQYLYLNSETGEGFEELIRLFSRFMKFKTSTMEFPSFSKEDLEQEMLTLAYEAIPRYDESKNANLMTFLQNHVQNRLINMCKFYSEKRRSSSHTIANIKKLRCNACRQFFRTKSDDNVVCPYCSVSGNIDSNLWKHYNLIAVPGQFFEMTEGGESQIEIDPDLSHFAVIGTSVANVDFKLDMERFIAGLDDEKKSIITLLSQGFTNLEIGKRLKLPVADVKAIVKNISAEYMQQNEETA